MTRMILCLLGIGLCLQMLILLPRPRRRKRNALYGRYRIHRFLGRLASMGGKRRLLKSYGWYPNICGGWTHPHAMDYMGPWEVLRCGMPELEYKLEHGSQAVLPPALKNRKGKNT